MNARVAEKGRGDDRPVILIVEDEPLLRFIAVDMVEEAGFIAVETANAIEAVAILERRDDIRLVFTDIDMPMGINGLRLAALVRDRWPPIHIIVVSDKAAPESAALPADAVFFAKPYSRTQVVDTMRRLAA